MNPRTLEWIALCLENAERKHSQDEIEAAEKAIAAFVASQSKTPVQFTLLA